MRRTKIILLLCILTLMVFALTGCGGDSNTVHTTGSEESPATQATLTFSAGEWYAQQTAIAVESTPNPPSPNLSK